MKPFGNSSLHQDPITGDMWFDNGIFMDVFLQFKR